MLPEPRAFRQACGRFATGVAVVTLRDAGGRPHGVTINSFTSVSLSPPLVLVCVDRTLTSHGALRTAGGWIVNVLRAEQEDLSRRFAGSAEDKFAGVDIEDGPFGAPRIVGALAHLAVRCHRVYDGGDHEIFVGRVTELDYEDGEPLIFFRSGYGIIRPGQFESKRP